MRREEEHAVRRVMTEEIPGKRKRGRPKTRWKDVCRRDMQTVGLRAGEEEDRAYWRARINNHTGDPRSLERPETTKKKKLDEVGSGEERPPTRRGNPGPGEGVIPARGRASRARGRGSQSVAVDHRFVVSRSRQAWESCVYQTHARLGASLNTPGGQTCAHVINTDSALGYCRPAARFLKGDSFFLTHKPSTSHK